MPKRAHGTGAVGVEPERIADTSPGRRRDGTNSFSFSSCNKNGEADQAGELDDEFSARALRSRWFVGEGCDAIAIGQFAKKCLPPVKVVRLRSVEQMRNLIL